MTGNKAHANYCGAKTRAGQPCKNRAMGNGRCRMHGGKSTGAKTEQGKKVVALNAIKHAAYVERILNEMEQQLYDLLFEETIEKYSLDTNNVSHMMALQRACMTYIKLLRLDEWEMEEEFVPNEPFPDPETGKDEPKKEPVYDLEGNEVGSSTGKVRRLRWAKHAPDWEAHFQKYMKLLATDRATEVKMKEAGDAAKTVVDTFGWLWGNKSEETQEG